MEPISNTDYSGTARNSTGVNSLIYWHWGRHGEDDNIIDLNYDQQLGKWYNNSNQVFRLANCI